MVKLLLSVQPRLASIPTGNPKPLESKQAQTFKPLTLIMRLSKRVVTGYKYVDCGYSQL